MYGWHWCFDWSLLKVNHTKRELHNVLIRKLYRWLALWFLYFLASSSIVNFRLLSIWNNHSEMMICCAGRTYLMTCWGKQMKYLSDGSVFKKLSKFLNRHTGYYSSRKCSCQLICRASIWCLYFQTLEEFPLEAEKLERGYSLSEYAAGLPKIHGLSNHNPMGILP